MEMTYNEQELNDALELVKPERREEFKEKLLEARQAWFDLKPRDRIRIEDDDGGLGWRDEFERKFPDVFDEDYSYEFFEAHENDYKNEKYMNLCTKKPEPEWWFYNAILDFTMPPLDE